METVVGVEVNGIGQFEDKILAQSSFPEQVADPVVYKLVRVEGDGRLVPATDDELMEVEEMFEDDSREIHLADTGQTEGCMPNEDFSNKKPQFEDSGLYQSDNAVVGVEKLTDPSEETIPSAPISNEKDVSEAPSVGEYLNTPEGPAETGSLSPEFSESLRREFSKLKGDINLDGLSIRELHATFKATFGRETSVKDKLWLKRRIAMGLTNSCDVSTTTFIIKNNKLVKGEEEICKNLDHASTKDLVAGAVDVNSRDSSVSRNSETEDHQIISGKRLKDPPVESNCKSDDLSSEQRAAKRVRKPTRRYIEELSEVESWERISAVRNPGHCNASLRSSLKPLEKDCSDERAVVTRLDSLGGSGVHVPYVSRVRRSRPRKNFITLMKFHPTGMAAKLVKRALSVHSSQSDRSEDRDSSARIASEQFEQLPITEQEVGDESTVKDTTANEQVAGPKHEDLSGNNSDDNLVNVPAPKGGMRRKHHRAWTLNEVMKLVEGVSRYGAGRWSEIKKLAFASYTYRTTVDLKDKWRNLLRASFAQMPAEKGLMNSRKQASVPIPAPILLRVRELAEQHAQNSPNFSSSKFAGAGGRIVHETSGFL